MKAYQKESTVRFESEMPNKAKQFAAFGCWTRYTAFRSPLLAALGVKIVQFSTMILLICLLYSSVSFGTECAGGYDGFESEEGLDAAYEEYSYVYVARIDRVDRLAVEEGRSRARFVNLSSYSPALKGSVPDTIKFQIAGICAPTFHKGDIYVFFSNSLQEAPRHENLRLVMLGERGPAYTWVVEWLSEKRLTSQG